MSTIGYAIQVAADQGRIIKPDPTPEKGSFYRSDHFPFAQQGVPALSSRDGIDYVGKPEGYGMQISNRSGPKNVDFERKTTI